MELKDISTADLINELKSRGYTTELLFCKEDVDLMLDLYNDSEETDDGPLELSDEDKEEILASLNFDGVIGMVNDMIFDEINKID
jgi:hypothetical protein